MKVLLVYPEFPDTFWSFNHTFKFTGKKALVPPLGLLTVAALLPPEWPKRLVDMNVQKLSQADLSWAEYVFISGMIVQKESVLRLISQCKKARKIIVAGGPLFTTEHESVLVTYTDVDHFVLNEAEVTLPIFLADLQDGKAKRIYSTSEFADLTRSPIPLWDLADLRQYEMASTQFSRGCPFNCDFCNVTSLLGHQTRHKTKEQIIAELDCLYIDHKWRDCIFFVDDNLISDKKYVKNELLPALIKWQEHKYKTPFNTQISINVADDEELMRMMCEAGFDIVFIGIETPNENSLAECNKKQNLSRDLVKNVQSIQRAGLQVQGGFIVGFDNDTPAIFQQQADFIQKTGIVTAMIGLLQAFPNTRFYERLNKEGRLLEGLSGDNADGTTNIVPIMDLKVLREGYLGLVRYIYKPVNFYQRVKTFLKDYKEPKTKVPFKTNSILMLLRCIYYLGIEDKERIQFWSLMKWALFHRPDLFSIAIYFAVEGYHFRKVSEEYITSEIYSSIVTNK
jgi:radical SAM superfamily enzyme YgiQ (UPF0313 family)